MAVVARGPTPPRPAFDPAAFLTAFQSSSQDFRERQRAELGAEAINALHRQDKQNASIMERFAQLDPQQRAAILLSNPQLLAQLNAQEFDAAMQGQQLEAADQRQQAQLEMQRAQLAQQQAQFDEQMTLRREQFEDDRSFKRAQLALQERKLAQESGGHKLSDIATIRKEFTNQSGTFVAIRDAHEKIRRTAEAEPSAAGDLSLIFSFMRLLDPGSVVREGEFATAQNAAGVPEQIRSNYNRLLRGERLRDFLNRSVELMNGQLEMQLQLEQQYGDLAQRYGIARDDIVIDFVGKYRQGVPVARVPGTGEGLLEQIDRELSSMSTTLRATSRPKIGDIEGGYRFKGGDPANPNSWELVE